MINYILGTNLQGYQKTYYHIPGTDKQMFLWMIDMQKKDKNWKNYDYDDIIVEEKINDIYTENSNENNPYRIVAKKIQINNSRVYEIKGLYKYNKDKSTNSKCIFVKIS